MNDSKLYKQNCKDECCAIKDAFPILFSAPKDMQEFALFLKFKDGYIGAYLMTFTWSVPDDVHFRRT